MSHCPSCGTIINAPRGRARSRHQENRFHALCAAAFQQWPESHWFQAKSADHLRYWLTKEAGGDFVEVVGTHRLPQTEDAIVIEGILAAIIRTSSDNNMFVDFDNGVVTAVRAKSTAPMTAQEYVALNHAVDDVLRAEGFDPEQLLREKAA